jgi:hypothetical protein
VLRRAGFITMAVSMKQSCALSSKPCDARAHGVSHRNALQPDV